VVLSSKTESWEGVDGDGRVILSTEALVTGRPPRERERARGSEREDERLAMTSGAGLSAREGERASARARQAALLGHGASLGRARARPGRSAGPDRREGRIAMGLFAIRSPHLPRVVPTQGGLTGPFSCTSTSSFRPSKICC
jgi:hypothetical protein